MDWLTKDWTTGQLNAVLKALGEETARKLAAGELTVRVVGQELVVEERVKLLFDRNGRRIPPQGLQSKVCDAHRNFHLTQPTIDYAHRLYRIKEHLQAGPMIFAAEFEDRCEKLLARIRMDERSSGILQGTCLPICIPQTTATDYGAALDEVFLPAVARSYQEQFPKRSFNNLRKGALKGQVTVVPGGRHEKLVEAMQQNVVFGLYFPNPLQGFSVLASREQMETLPEQFLLSGGYDVAVAMIAYPDVLAGDYNTPGLDMAALQWQEPACSLYFGAYDGRLCLDCRGFLGFASGGYSGGLFVLG